MALALLISVVSAGLGLLLGLWRGPVFSRVGALLALTAAICALSYFMSVPRPDLGRDVPYVWALWCFAIGFVGPSLDRRFHIAALVSTLSLVIGVGVGFYILLWLSRVSGQGCT